MDATQNRLNNFLVLFEEFKAANPHLPERGMHKLFCEKIDVSPLYLSHVRHGRRGMGTATARQIEKRCGKPHGWMDAHHDILDPRNEDEQFVQEQVLMLYRKSPETVRKLIQQAMEEILEPQKPRDARRS